MTKKTRIKIGIVLVITCVMGFSDWSFADGPDNEVIARLMHFIIDCLAWLWVVFARIAGEFLTNKWVYGENLGIDTLLWKYRSVVKNMANFALGLYFVFMIFKGLIYDKKGGDILKSLKDTLMWILVAGIGIQLSWFMVAAIIDISTITFVTAGSLPYQLVSHDSLNNKGSKSNLHETFINSIKDKYKDEISNEKGRVAVLGDENAKANQFFSLMETVVKIPEDKTLLDSILPTADSLEGPLYYMGYVLLNTDHVNSYDSSDENSRKKVIVNVVLQSGTTIVYSIEMIVLCVLSLMRILYLRMFIVVSPLAVLIRCIEKGGEKLGGKGVTSFIEDFKKHVNFQSFFINVFKPTIIALGISITVIVVTLIRGLLINDANLTTDLGGVKIYSKEDSNRTNIKMTDKYYITGIESDTFEVHIKGIGKSLLDIMLSILTVVLVYMIISAAVKMGGGNDFVSKKIGKLQEGIGKTITSIPIIPVAGYDENGEPAVRHINRKDAMNFSENKINRYTQKFQTDSRDQTTNIINSWFNDHIKTLSTTAKGEITAAGNSSNNPMDILGKKKEKIKEIYQKEGLKGEERYGMILNTTATDQFWRTQFEKWLTDMNGQESKITETNDKYWKKMITRWNDGKNNDKSLEKMFTDGTDGSNFVKAYAEFFDLNLSSNTWEQLKNADISKK